MKEGEERSPGQRALYSGVLRMSHVRAGLGEGILWAAERWAPAFALDPQVEWVAVTRAVPGCSFGTESGGEHWAAGAAACGPWTLPPPSTQSVLEAGWDLEMPSWEFTAWSDWAGAGGLSPGAPAGVPGRGSAGPVWGRLLGLS